MDAMETLFARLRRRATPRAERAAVAPNRRWVLLASELYSLAILRPLASEALSRGHAVAWIANDALARHLTADERRLRSWRALKRFAPDAVFSTVNRIPAVLPGLQVQLFHGLNLHKRDPRLGQFRIQHLFDLYCTHGPATTAPLRALAEQHGTFAVIETGWPKLDLLFSGPSEGADALRRAANGRPLVMYASTFNAPLSQAHACLPVLQQLIARGDRFWLLTLHPMSPPELVARYRQLAGAHALYLETERLADMLHAADALVCDTSSVVEEFALLGKPVLTVRHRQPQPFMHDLDDPERIDATLTQVLADPQARRAAMDAYADGIHPARDGRSSARILDAVGTHLEQRSGLRRRPRKPWRRWWRTWTMLRELLPG